MQSETLTYIIIILLSIVVGMLLGLMIRPTIYRGPYAHEESRKMYQDNKTGRCLHFGIRAMNCPAKRTRWRRLLDDFTKMI